MIGVEEKGQRVQCRTKTTMDFNPTPKILCNQKEVDEYLEQYGIRLPSNIKVEWCTPDINYIETSKAGGLYLHPQILAFG